MGGIFLLKFLRKCRTMREGEGEDINFWIRMRLPGHENSLYEPEKLLDKGDWLSIGPEVGR